MRTKNDSVGEKFANLILEKRIGFSSFIEELSEAIENEIREINGESSTLDESDSEDEHTSNGRTYHDFNLLNDYEPHESIEHLLKNNQIDSLVELSDDGYISVEVMRTYMGPISHEWDLTLRCSESPHAKSNRFIELRIVLEFMFRREEKIKITQVSCDVSDEDLSKIYIAYALKYD
jgi:hypothetical protein